MAIQISSCTVIDNNRCLTNIANASSSSVANTYVIRDANRQIFSCIINPNICRSGGVYWIVAPNASEVSRTWYCRNDANTTAQSVSGCTGWFVPTNTQLLNPGYCCRRYWDSFSSSCYWSSTEHFLSDCSCPVNFANGTFTLTRCKTNMFCVRAFRCVIY